MLQMHQNGELVEELRKAGIRSALLDKVQQTSKTEDTKQYIRNRAEFTFSRPTILIDLMFKYKSQAEICGVLL